MLLVATGPCSSLTNAKTEKNKYFFYDMQPFQFTSINRQSFYYLVHRG